MLLATLYSALQVSRNPTPTHVLNLSEKDVEWRLYVFINQANYNGAELINSKSITFLSMYIKDTLTQRARERSS